MRPLVILTVLAIFALVLLLGWNTLRPILEDPAWQGIGTLVAILSLILDRFLAKGNTAGKPSNTSQSSIPQSQHPNPSTTSASLNPSSIARVTPSKPIKAPSAAVHRSRRNIGHLLRVIGITTSFMVAVAIIYNGLGVCHWLDLAISRSGCSRGWTVTSPGQVVNSSDGTIIAVENELDGSIQLINTLDGALLNNLSGHPSYERTMLFVPDQDVLLVASWGQQSDVVVLQRWRISDGKLLATIHIPVQVQSEALFSPDGNLLLTPSRGLVQAFLTEDGTMLYSTTDVQYFANHFAVSRTVFATYHLYEPIPQVRIWNMPDGRLLHTINTHKQDGIILSPNGDRLLISGGMFQYSIPDGAELPQLDEDGWGFSRLAYSPDGNYIAAVGTAEEWRFGGRRFFDRVWVWRVSDGRIVNTYDVSPKDIIFTNDSKSLIMTVNDGVGLWRLD